MRTLWRSKAVWRQIGKLEACIRDHRAPHPRNVRWLSVGAAGGLLSTVGLLAGDRPALAKELDVRQEVWVWGRRQSIPGGADRDVLRPRRVRWFEDHKPGWKKLAFGPSFGAALDQNGRIYVWGLSEMQTEDGLEEVFIGPVALDAQSDARGHRFVDVQCSSEHIFALTARGGTYVFNNITETLRRTRLEVGVPLRLKGQAMPGIPQPSWSGVFFGGSGVVQMSIGLEHAAFVTRRGELLCTGTNQWGQCGEEPPRQEKKMGALEEKVRVETVTPVKVSFPANAGRIKSVAVGGHHTIAMDDLGQGFSFGDDRRIQLGLGDTRHTGGDERNAVGVLSRDFLGGKGTKADVKRRVTYGYYDQHMQAAPVELIPPPVSNRPAYPPCSFLACGQDFTVAAHRDSPDWYSKEEETNVLFCCGENGEGQCGRNRQQQQQPWIQVRLPKRTKIVAVACGQGHTVAQMSNGDLWAWGMNQQGEVGNGTRASTCPPVKLELDASDSSEVGTDRKVASVTCGFRNSGCICEVRQHTN